MRVAILQRQAAVNSTRQILEQLTTRGLLSGTQYGPGRLNGLWGLYGTYDYFAPEDFQFSSTGFSIGTTLQARIIESLVVQDFGAGG